MKYIAIFIVLLSITVAKKGIGLSNSKGWNEVQLNSLNIDWYYNWGAQSSLVTPVAFVPMVFSPKSSVKPTTGQQYVFGFNEPDNIQQQNTTLAQALTAWPNVMSIRQFIGAPATASNPLTNNSWQTQFIQSLPGLNLTVDFMTVHWYKGPNSAQFISDITAIYNLYGLPIWVTEFACQTASSSKANPTKFTQTQVNNFITTVTAWMDSVPFVHRYAWHDSQIGTSQIFNSDGTLTATGIIYSQVLSPSMPSIGTAPNAGGN